MPRQGIKNKKSTFGTVTPLRGRYWARFTDDSGKRRSAGTFPTERAAWNRLEQIRRGQRVPEPGTVPTFRELAEMVAEARTDLADGTRRNNASMLRTTLSDFADKRADKITLLLAVRLDRVSRSVGDFAGLLERSQRKGWDIAFTSSPIDTSTSAGRFSAHVLAAASELERGLIADRTREALAQRKAEGVILGRVVRTTCTTPTGAC